MLRTSRDPPSTSMLPQTEIVRPQPVDVMTPNLQLVRRQTEIVRPQPVDVMTPNLQLVRRQTDTVRPQPVDVMTPNLQLVRLRDTSQPTISCRTLAQHLPRQRQRSRPNRSKVAETSFDVEGERRATRRLERRWKSSHRSARLGRSIQCRSAAVISDDAICDMIPLSI